MLNPGNARPGDVVYSQEAFDRIMTQLHDEWPQYEFAKHKGYVTSEHSAALREHGPCPHHRMRYINVQRAAALRDRRGPATLGQDEMDDLTTLEYA